MKSAIHEPCLYRGRFNNEEVLVLRQVDDFAIPCATEATSSLILDAIDNNLSTPMTRQGIIKYFNGMTICQSCTNTTITVEQYLTKLQERHSWQDMAKNRHHKPLPFTTNRDDIRALETTIGPTDTKEVADLEKDMGFSYRAAIGELIFAMVTCRPDITFPVVKLSQYSTHPAPCNFTAVKNIFRYLFATKNEGITHWPLTVHPSLPDMYSPKIYTSVSEQAPISNSHETPSLLFGYVDSDWGSDTTHRRSVSGM